MEVRGESGRPGRAELLAKKGVYWPNADSGGTGEGSGKLWKVAALMSASAFTPICDQQIGIARAERVKSKALG